MTFDYARANSTADRLLTRFGQSATLRVPTKTGDAHNPTVGTPTDYTTTIVVMEYNDLQIDGERVMATDKKVLMAVIAIEPTTAHKLLIGGIEHSIIRVKPMSPAGTVVYNELQVRR